MTGEALFALLGELDEALVDGAEALPERRRARGRFRPAVFAAAAACAALVILAVTPGLLRAGRDLTLNSASGGQSEDIDMTSKPEDVNPQSPDAPGASVEDATGDCAKDQGFYAVIVSLTPELTVSPAEGSPLWGQAELVILTMTDRAPEADGMPEDLKPGETVWVSCPIVTLIRRDGATLEAPTVYGLSRE